jgi:hypothetical protein
MRRISQILILFAALGFGSVAHAAGPPPAQAIYNWGGVNADVSSTPATIPEATFVLLATIPIAARSTVEVQNQSAALIQVVLDDGAATAGTQSSILLNPGTGANTGGTDWVSNTFKGRVRVYGATGAQVMARQN